MSKTIMITTVNAMEKFEVVRRLLGKDELYDNNPYQNLDIKLVLADAENSVSNNFLSKKYNLPYVNLPYGLEYNSEILINAVKDAIRKYDIDIILPFDFGEATILSMASRNGEFDEFPNLKIMCNSKVDFIYEDKIWQLNRMKNSFSKVLNDLVDDYLVYDGNDKDHVFNNVHKMGDEFIIKPITSRGSRGFRLVKRNFNMNSDYYCSKSPYTISFGQFKYIINNCENELLIQKYYPGESYSVDCYVRNDGKVITAPSKRLGWRWGQLQFCEICYPDDVIEVAEELAKEFEFDNHFNFEVNRDKDGKLKLIEMNTRLSAGAAYGMLTKCDPLLHSLADCGVCEYPNIVLENLLYNCTLQSSFIRE